MAEPHLKWNDDQVRARLDNLRKWEWGFNQVLSNQAMYFQLDELVEMNEHYYAIYGAYNNVYCSDCLATWIKPLAEWYFEQKKRYA